MSRKRRENQEKRAATEWTRVHYAIGLGVVVLSALVAIAVYTIVVGTSFGKEKPNIVDALPAQGAEFPAEKSPASDALNKPWDQTSQDERDLIARDTTRVFENVTFRASSGLLPGIDVIIDGGKTQLSRGYAQLKDPPANRRFAESLTFYCPTIDGKVHAYKYLTGPDSTTLSDQIQDPGTQPWQTILSRIDWTQDVTDLGIGEVDGRKVHGYRVFFDYSKPSDPSPKMGEYWFDVENARLLARQEYIEGKDTLQTRYVLRYRAIPPARIEATQPQPDCVPDLLAKYGG